MTNIKFVKKANMWLVQTWRMEKDKKVQIWKWFTTKEKAEEFSKKQL